MLHEREAGPEPNMDAARILPLVGDVSVKTLFNWVRSGRFPAPDFVVGKRRLWKLSTVRAWLEQHATVKEVTTHATA